MNDNIKASALEEIIAVLAIIVAAMQDQGVHSGNELPDDQYVEVHLTAGDIRRAVAALNAVGNSTANNLGED